MGIRIKESGMYMKNKILVIGILIMLILTSIILTGCGNEEQENQNVNNTENTENTQNSIETTSSEDEGIETGDKVLKYGAYEGKDLAEGVTIILNADKTFEYEDDENNNGTGTYEVKNEEIEDIEGTYETWVIEFDSLNTTSKGKIPSDKYMLFTQTGDISNEESGLNFDYIEENLDMTNADDVSAALDKAEKDTFNAKFEQYEWELRGSQVKSLLSQVISNNLTSDKIVTVENNGEEFSSTEDINGLSSRISTGMTYNITLEYENELVSKIVIE